MLPTTVMPALPPGPSHEKIRLYHERSKHRPEGYAAGPASLDWEARPAPFRRHDGAPFLALPLLRELPVRDPRRLAFASPFAFPHQARGPVVPWDIATLGVLLEASFGITAFKSDGLDRWALRASPSSGNLHPVEAYVIVWGVQGVESGVYHHCPERHGLERRRRLAVPPEGTGVLVGLTSVMWREAWKYGERAFRYCQLDVGHACAALTVAARLLGLEIADEPRLAADTLGHWLGGGLEGAGHFDEVSSTEREEPELLLRLTGLSDASFGALVAALDRQAEASQLLGVPSVIDAHPLYEWPAITEMARLTRRPARASPQPTLGAHRPARELPRSSATAEEVIWGRRSAQRFDATFTLPRASFVELLEVLPEADGDLEVAVLVLRVEGLAAGTYRVDRQGRGHTSGLPLRAVACWPPALLARTSRSLHCHQDVAARACVVFVFFASFEEERLGEAPHLYREAHRRAGALGHALYLAAEAEGARATGIGCFLDDGVRELFALQETPLMPLYHLALGRPLPDPRLDTHPAYPERAEKPSSWRQPPDARKNPEVP